MAAPCMCYGHMLLSLMARQHGPGSTVCQFLAFHVNRPGLAVGKHADLVLNAHEHYSKGVLSTASTQNF